MASTQATPAKRLVNRAWLKNEIREAANTFARFVRLGKVPHCVEDERGLCMSCRLVPGRRFRFHWRSSHPRGPASYYICSSPELCVVCAMAQLGGAARVKSDELMRLVQRFGHLKW